MPTSVTERMSPHVEIIDLAPGLWIWRLDHPAWKPDADWQQVVTCVCVDAGTERDQEFRRNSHRLLRVLSVGFSTHSTKNHVFDRLKIRAQIVTNVRHTPDGGSPAPERAAAAGVG